MTLLVAELYLEEPSQLVVSFTWAIHAYHASHAHEITYTARHEHTSHISYTSHTHRMYHTHIACIRYIIHKTRKYTPTNIQTILNTHTQTKQATKQPNNQEEQRQIHRPKSFDRRGTGDVMSRNGWELVGGEQETSVCIEGARAARRVQMRGTHHVQVNTHAAREDKIVRSNRRELDAVDGGVFFDQDRILGNCMQTIGKNHVGWLALYLIIRGDLLVPQ